MKSTHHWSTNHWTSQITEVKHNQLRVRGFAIQELIGSLGFSQVMYMVIKGRLPSDKEAMLLDSILVAMVDHGCTPPSTIVARTIASTATSLHAAVAGAVLAMGKCHAGAIEDCALTLHELIESSKRHGWSIRQAAEQLVHESSCRGKRIPGLGHRIHTEDPRATRLLAMAEEHQVAGQGVEAMLALRDVMATCLHKPLPINIDGAAAAILTDLDFPPELASAVFIIGRIPGIVAHVFEEMTLQRPMRCIHPTDHSYDGPELQALTDYRRTERYSFDQ